MCSSDLLLELGLKSLARLLLSRVSLRVLMTPLSLSEDPLLTLILLYIDDMIISGDCSAGIRSLALP